MPKYDTGPARLPAETRGMAWVRARKVGIPRQPAIPGTVRRVAYSGTFFALYWGTEEQKGSKEIRPFDDASIK